MLAAKDRGVRGLCEVRDAGLPVPLTDEGPTVHEADLDDALTRNELARAILATESLEAAEQYSREVCGYSEIDYERNKASWLGNRPEQYEAPLWRIPAGPAGAAAPPKSAADPHLRHKPGRPW